MFHLFVKLLTASDRFSLRAVENCQLNVDIEMLMKSVNTFLGHALNAMDYS